jgi:hypothetical protein
VNSLMPGSPDPAMPCRRGKVGIRARSAFLGSSPWKGPGPKGLRGEGSEKPMDITGVSSALLRCPGCLTPETNIRFVTEESRGFLRHV